MINVNVLVQQIEWDLIGTAAETQCIWFGLDLQNMSSWASSFHCKPPQPLLSILLSELLVLNVRLFLFFFFHSVKLQKGPFKVGMLVPKDLFFFPNHKRFKCYFVMFFVYFVTLCFSHNIFCHLLFLKPPSPLILDRENAAGYMVHHGPISSHKQPKKKEVLKTSKSRALSVELLVT